MITIAAKTTIPINQLGKLPAVSDILIVITNSYK